MRIRDATEDDSPSIARLLDELGYPATPEQVVRRVASLIARDDYAVLVVEADDEILGVGTAHVFPVIHQEGPVAIIAALVVSSSVRRSGVGRNLVTELERFAHSSGCKRLQVTTANHRADAHAFYERLGFVFTGRRYVKEM